MFATKSAQADLQNRFIAATTTYVVDRTGSLTKSGEARKIGICQNFAAFHSIKMEPVTEVRESYRRCLDTLLGPVPSFAVATGKPVVVPAASPVVIKRVDTIIHPHRDGS